MEEAAHRLSGSCIAGKIQSGKTGAKAIKYRYKETIHVRSIPSGQTCRDAMFYVPPLTASSATITYGRNYDLLSRSLATCNTTTLTNIKKLARDKPTS